MYICPIDTTQPLFLMCTTWIQQSFCRFLCFATEQFFKAASFLKMSLSKPLQPHQHKVMGRPGGTAPLLTSVDSSLYSLPLDAYNCLNWNFSSYKSAWGLIIQKMPGKLLKPLERYSLQMLRDALPQAHLVLAQWCLPALGTAGKQQDHAHALSPGAWSPLPFWCFLLGSCD